MYKEAENAAAAAKVRCKSLQIDGGKVNKVLRKNCEFRQIFLALAKYLCYTNYI